MQAPLIIFVHSASNEGRRELFLPSAALFSSTSCLMIGGYSPKKRGWANQPNWNQSLHKDLLDTGLLLGWNPYIKPQGSVGCIMIDCVIHQRFTPIGVERYAHLSSLRSFKFLFINSVCEAMCFQDSVSTFVWRFGGLANAYTLI